MILIWGAGDSPPLAHNLAPLSSLPSPTPAEIPPEDEVRAAVVASQLSHEAQLERVLQSLRKDNDALEAEVAAADARARVVTAAVGEFKALFDQVRGRGGCVPCA